MKQSPLQPTPANEPLSVLPVEPIRVGRRWFVRYLGLAATGGALLSSCASENLVEPSGARSLGSARAGDIIDLGSGDIGILNYAYTLEQIELRFLEMVLDMPYNGMSQYERNFFVDLRNQELTHVVFYRTVLGSKGIPTLTKDYSSVDFTSRDSVLQTGRTFADLATAAYNGAGKYLSDGNNLATAGKLVSVEARHAAIYREIIQPGTTYFAGDDATNPMTGLDPAYEPSFVLPKAQAFVKEIITANNLPANPLMM